MRGAAGRLMPRSASIHRWRKAAMWRRILFIVLIVIVLGVAGFVAWAWEPAIALNPPPGKSSFDRELVQRGAELAAIGNCGVCHTSAGGKPFAGGRPLVTPFGTIHA